MEIAKTKAKCKCSYCRNAGHTRRNCPKRAKSREAKHAWNGECPACADLPWRRSAPMCSGCGGYYAAEPPVTLQDILNRPREDRRPEL